MPPGCATRSASSSTRRTARSGSPTTRPTAWATTSRRARSTARPRPGSSSATRGCRARPGSPKYGYDKDPLPPNITDPQVYMDAHAADLGLAFYTGKKFPAKYQRRPLLGAARLVEPHQTDRRADHVHLLKADGTADKTEVFAEGWLDPRDRRLSRPAGGRGDDEGRFDAGLRRLRRCALPHHATANERCSHAGSTRRARAGSAVGAAGAAAARCDGAHAGGSAGYRSRRRGGQGQGGAVRRRATAPMA